NPARFPHGAAGSPGHGQGGGTAGGHDRTYICLRAAPGRVTAGRGHVAAGPAAVGGGRDGVPAGYTTAGDVYVPACADSGCCVSVVAAESPATGPPAHCTGVRSPFPRHR